MSIRAARTRLASDLNFGEGVELAHPATPEELAALLAEATAKRKRVLIWGGGTHQGIGYSVVPELVVFTDRLDRWLDWQPEDLTVVVEAGVTVADLEAKLASEGQTAILAETGQPPATVGGALAAGISGFRRARYGPTRDRVLEVQIVTGDGRLVRAGGRVVKNVTGYDLPRLAVGSFGGLGVIVSCCLKLWPLAPAAATVTIGTDHPAPVSRPLAMLADRDATRVFLSGSVAEVEDQVRRLQGEVVEGLAWPTPPLGDWCFSLRVPPAAAREMLGRLPTACDYLHQVGVGEVSIAAASPDGMPELRRAAEAAGGSLVVIRGDDEVFAPWGAPPATLDLQRRLLAAFDPARILNPGRLPGRL